MDPTAADNRAATAEGEERPRGQDPASERPAWAQLLIALSPLSVILVAYAVAQWVSAPLSHGELTEGEVNRLGAGLQIIWPAAADRATFGTLPTVWLQDLLLRPEAQWWDVVASVVYLTHYVALPVATGCLWFLARQRFAGWVTSVLVLTLASIATYMLFPASPPWLAADLGVVEPVERLSAFGWEGLGLEPVGAALEGLQGDSNPVAAMPSLHAAVPALLAVFLWPGSRWWWRVATCGYALLMAWTLVYTGEHYVVDVLAGWLGAGAAVATARLSTLLRERRTDPEDSGPGVEARDVRWTPAAEERA